MNNQNDLKIEKAFSKEASELLKVGFLHKYKNREDRFEKYRDFIKKNESINKAFLGMIIFDENNDFKEFYENELLVENLIFIMNDVSKETVYTNKVKIKYFEYLIENKKYDKIYKSTYFKKETFNEIFKKYKNECEDIDLIIKFGDKLDVYELLYNEKHILHKNIIEKIIQYSSYNSNENLIFNIFSKELFENDEIGKYNEINNLIIKKIISIIKNIPNKNPQIIHNLMKFPLEIQDISDLIFFSNNTLSTKCFLDCIHQIHIETLKNLCINFGFDILCEFLIKKIKTHNTSIFHQILIWLQQILMSYCELSWDEIHLIKVNMYASHLEKMKNNHEKESIIEEIINVNEIELTDVFGNLLFKNDYANNNHINNKKKIKKEIRDLFVETLKTMKKEHQLELTDETIHIFDIADKLSPELIITRNKKINKKVIESFEISDEELCQLFTHDIEFSDDVNILDFLCKYISSKKFIEICNLMLENENNKNKILNEIVFCHKTQKFELIKKLCEAFPNLFINIFENFIKSINNKYLEIGCSLVTTKTNIDSLKLLEFICNSKETPYLCKICYTYEIGIACKICGQVLCVDCDKNKKINRCYFCNQPDQKIILKI